MAGAALDRLAAGLGLAGHYLSDGARPARYAHARRLLWTTEVAEPRFTRSTNHTLTDKETRVERDQRVPRRMGPGARGSRPRGPPGAYRAVDVFEPERNFDFHVTARS